ncbi:MAG TPA: tRNA pseudouridine(55) synthase TruB, partial [Micromonosporaceae bacterium]
GQSTITDDAEGELVTQASAADVTETAVRARLAGFVGEIDQVPSAVSAIKVNGVRSYARVRQGSEVDLPARRVTVFRLEVHSVHRHDDLLDVAVEVSCSSGTYIRAIARDLGAALGVGGHLTALRRTAVGAFTLAEAVTLEELAQRPDPVTMSLEDAADRCFTRRDVDEGAATVLSHGGSLPPIGQAGPYAVFGPAGRLLAIVSERAGRARPDVVLAPAGQPA